MTVGHLESLVELKSILGGLEWVSFRVWKSGQFLTGGNQGQRNKEQEKSQLMNIK
jgi:hypothetical protein